MLKSNKTAVISILLFGFLWLSHYATHGFRFPIYSYARGLSGTGTGTRTGIKLRLAVGRDDTDFDLRALTVVQLKAKLRDVGLPVSGLKQDLIGRLLDNDNAGRSCPPSAPARPGSGTKTGPSAAVPVTAADWTTTTQAPPTSSSTTFSSPPLSPSGSTYILQFDGGSRGNPGPAGAGSLVMDSTGRVVWKSFVYLGPNFTNNVAEYRALIEGLKQVVHMRLPRVRIQGDSQLVLRQVGGVYKVNNANLKAMHAQAVQLLEQVPAYDLEYIPRALNAQADGLANAAMETCRTEQWMP